MSRRERERTVRRLVRAMKKSAYCGVIYSFDRTPADIWSIRGEAARRAFLEREAMKRVGRIT
jgi:hypothetical protein